MRTKNYTIRTTLVLLSFLFLHIIIGIRLYLIQVKNKHLFQTLAGKQYQVEVTLQPLRGAIYDQSGTVPLAINKEVSSAFLLPHQLGNKTRTYSFLKKHFPKKLAYIKNKPNLKFVWLSRNINPTLEAQCKKDGINDIHFLTEPQRFYPFPETSQIIGFTNIDNNGICGMELACNEQLKGTPMILNVEKDARAKRFYFHKEVKQTGSSGESLTLTLDSTLQFMAAKEVAHTVKAFKAKSGAAIILNPVNGHVLSMVNYPFFNPNTDAKDNMSVVKNTPVSECYELGSVMKIFAALAALDEGVTTPDEMIDCEGKIKYFGSFKVENWKELGVLPFSDVVVHSSNVGMAKVTKRLGTKLYDHFQKLGFGKKTGIEFPGERSGFLNPPHNWSKSSIFVLPFGYEITSTLLQLARACAIISNDGYDVHPTLLKQTSLTPPPAPEKLYSNESISHIKDILETIGQKYGQKGFRVMGKTGTARMAQKGGYSTTRHLYTFSGIVEKGDYKRVIITFIKEPEREKLWASQVAAPLFGKIAEKMILHDTLTTANLQHTPILQQAPLAEQEPLVKQPPVVKDAEPGTIKDLA